MRVFDSRLELPSRNPISDSRLCRRALKPQSNLIFVTNSDSMYSLVRRRGSLGTHPCPVSAACVRVTDVSATLLCVCVTLSGVSVS